MIQGNIDLSQFDNWHRELTYKAHYAPLTGFQFVDPYDYDRYKHESIIAHIHKGLDLEKENYFKKQFSKSKNPLFAIHKMLPGMILPYHTDQYAYFLKTNPDITIDQVYRIIVFLEDWKPGHISEVEYDSHTKWKAGDWFFWLGKTPHMAANFGHIDRYTLQITGYIE
jgi:hypothetical protein